jgi:hypothetical protein
MPASIYKGEVQSLEGHAPFGDGECVALPQAVTDVGHTSRWYPGLRVVDLSYLNPGTVIANFVQNGRFWKFPNRHGYHAALFMGFGPRSMATGEYTGIYVIDQWMRHPASARTIVAYSPEDAKRRRIKPSDNANDFYVVQT